MCRRLLQPALGAQQSLPCASSRIGEARSGLMLRPHILPPFETDGALCAACLRPRDSRARPDDLTGYKTIQIALRYSQICQKWTARLRRAWTETRVIGITPRIGNAILVVAHYFLRIGRGAGP